MTETPIEPIPQTPSQTAEEVIGEADALALEEVRQLLIDHFYPVTNGFPAILAQLRTAEPEHPIEFDVEIEGDVYGSNLQCSYKLELCLKEKVVDDD